MVEENENNPIIGFDPASPEGDYQASVIAERNEDGSLSILDVEIEKTRPYVSLFGKGNIL